jgi:hypothetical protein
MPCIQNALENWRLQPLVQDSSVYLFKITAFTKLCLFSDALLYKSLVAWGSVAWSLKHSELPKRHESCLLFYELDVYRTHINSFQAPSSLHFIDLFHEFGILVSDGMSVTLSGNTVVMILSFARWLSRYLINLCFT